MAITEPTDTDERIRILIADDQEFAVLGLKNLFEGVDDMTVIGLCRTANEVETSVPRLLPGIVLLDLSWYRADDIGFQLIETIRELSPSTKIIPISNYPELIERAKKMGTAPLDKGFTIHQLFAHIRRVHASDALPDSAAATVGLTEREIEILKLISQGDIDREIASKLNVEVTTVKKHVGNILSKTGTRTRTHAAVMATNAGLI